MLRALSVLVTFVLLGDARADEPACPAGIPSLGSSRLQAIPSLEEPTEAALQPFAEALVQRYTSCQLAPFDPRASRVNDTGEAYSHDLGRRVGKYRIRPDGGAAVAAGRAVELFGVEVGGAAPKALELLSVVTTLRPWPVRKSGEVVSGCRVELQRAKRAELCVALDGVVRRQANVVSTQLRAVVTCAAPLSPDDVALVWLSPVAPPPLVPLTTKRSPEAVASFTAILSADDPVSRELVCDEGRKWCASMTEGGGLGIVHDRVQLGALPAGTVEGFELVGAPSRWIGIEHLVSGLRVARSLIGTLYGFPSADVMRWWLAGGDCLLWQKRVSAARTYPAPIELRSLCLVDGAWVEGAHAAVSVRGNVRQVAQRSLIDDVPTRCAYTAETDARE